MNQNLHKLIGTKMKSGNKGVKGMSIKNMETFIKKHAADKLKRVQKKDRMTLGRIMSEFKEGKNKLEEGRNSPKKSASPKKNTNNANFKTMKSVKVKRNWANMNNNSNFGSLPVSPASSKSSVSGYGSSPNEGKNFFVKPLNYRNTFAFNQEPKKGSVNIFPVKGSRRPLTKVSLVPKRTYLQVMIGPGKGTESIKAYDKPIMGKFPKEVEYNAPISKSVTRKGVVQFNTTHFRPLRSNSPPRRTVAPSIPRKAPFVLTKFLESIKKSK
jgi:hypothetical protein